MKRLLCTLAGCLMLATSLSAQPRPVPPPPPPGLPKLTFDEAKFLAPYLTKDFTLTAALEVRDELTGFGTFFGTIWRIETDGSWTITRILEKKPILIGKGQLTKTQVVDLARKLAVYDPLSLPNFGQPLINPHVVTVSFGKASVLTFGVDQILPPTKLDDLKKNVAPGDSYVFGKNAPGQVIPPLDPPTRYAGIEWAMRFVIQPNLGVQLNLPERLKQLGHPE